MLIMHNLNEEINMVVMRIKDENASYQIKQYTIEEITNEQFNT